jgi:hypothetical protein
MYRCPYKGDFRIVHSILVYKSARQEEVYIVLLRILQSLIYLGETVLHGRHPTNTEQHRQLSQSEHFSSVNAHFTKMGSFS